MLKGNEIRQLFLDFFEKKHKHTIVESSSLVPDNPTVLLTTAGMLQFLPIFLGIKKSPYEPARAASCQKCARAGGKDSDIENVGRTPRHHTFFEMLGNFSFGDYYKKEIIEWSWDFVTNYLKLDKDRLWITIYEKDDEAFDYWRAIGIPEERIKRKGKKDNFWGPPGAAGSCGPCSEIHYDLGEEFKCSDDCGIDTCECDRWVEIWNLVFTELYQDEEGNQSPLEKKNVDTGMGLERVTMVCQGVTSTFETDLLRPILNKVCEMSGKKYKETEKTDISLRIITDHARCVSFLISDGVIPGNEGRSYVLRMILRRALRHGKILGMELPFLYKLVDTVIDCYKSVYPDLEKNKDKIKDTIRKEEEKFKLTLDRGYKLINTFVEEKKNIDGENAFKLYDTLGFPFELTKEIAEENGLSVDEEGFKKAMQEQKDRAKAATQKISVAGDIKYAKIEEKVGTTNFVGYEEFSSNSKILDFIDGDGFVDVVLDKTPFYAESGGQIGDSGIIENDELKLEVITTFKVNDLFVHRCKLINGDISLGANVSAYIDAEKRREIMVHHTSAHLLQASLINVLGNEVKQAGSLVEENRMRFDFTFSRAMTPQEIEKTEYNINMWIKEGLPLSTKVMKIEEANQTGATALFGEKYGDYVRVVHIGNENNYISKEFCGGTHAKNTKDLRLFKIVSEGAIAAGTRRIEAVVSDSAIDFVNKRISEINKISSSLKVNYNEIEERIEKLFEENKNNLKEINNLKSEISVFKFQTLLSKTRNITDGKLLISKIENLDNQSIKSGVEFLSDKLKDSIIILVSEKMVLVKVSDLFINKGINAGKIVGEISRATGANGGGKPNFAQGGIKDFSLVDSVLEKIEKELI